MPKDLSKVIRDGGGIEEWLWKGGENPTARIDVIVINSKSQQPLRHILGFYARAIDYRLEIINESIESEKKGNVGYSEFCFDDKYNGQKAFITQKSGLDKELNWESIEANQSILAQRQDSATYPEMASLSSFYEKIRLYREWQFGRNAAPRTLQCADLPNEFLEEDASNLGLILNSLRRNPEIKRKLLDALKLFNESIADFDVIVQGGYIQVFFEENGFTIPASRLSDGTLRSLCLLAILLHPNPPPLICIEEPELGLYPDILPTLIDLLKEAAQKTQLIITTHSADLVDALSDMPEAVLVFDKHEGSTTVTRLNKEDLTDWLQDYSLGQLWSRGHIGGNRW